MNYFQRNELYWGKDFQEELSKKNIAIIGLGGVGGFALEALIRVGISNFTILDFDKISETNINRQIIATSENIGELKTKEWEKRLKLINPQINLRIYNEFLENSILDEVLTPKPDFIVDAIDTVKSKLELIDYAKKHEIQIITSMGAGNRIDASKLKTVDISEIKTNCNFANNLIKNLKNLGIGKDLPVVFSDEKPHNIEKLKNTEKIQTKSGEIEITKFSPASISTVPAVAGYLMANYVILEFWKNYRWYFFHAKITLEDKLC